MIKPATPGTVIVLLGTILLVLATVTVPVTKGLYLFKAELSTTVSSVSINETLKLGVLGYCVGNTCSNTSIGYQVDIAELLGITGTIATEIDNLIGEKIAKWLTYVLVLVPISAAFGLISFLLGLTAHIRECGGTCLTVFVAGLGSTCGWVVFIFQVVVVVILKKRIESSDVNGTASFGNGVWLTLVGTLCFSLSGCFFCCGRRIIHDRPPRRQMSDREDGFAHPQRGSELQASQSDSFLGKARYGNYGNHSTASNLPVFAELRGDDAVPLNSLSNEHDEDDIAYQQGHGMQYDNRASTHSGTVLTGVGMGYGRRDDGRGRQVSLAPESSFGGHAQQAVASEPQYVGGYVQSPPPTSPVRSQGHYSQQPSHENSYSSFSHGGGGAGGYQQGGAYQTPYDPPQHRAQGYSAYAEPPVAQGSLPLPGRSLSPVHSVGYSQEAPTYQSYEPYSHQPQHQNSYPPQGQAQGYTTNHYPY